jgi:hypothetical protein
MNFNKIFLTRGDNHKNLFRFLSIVVIVISLLIILNFLAPQLVSVILNLLWLILLTIIVTFFTLGVLVIVGMRKKVGQVLDIVLESSLTIIDFAEFVKVFIRNFKKVLKEFVLYIAPVGAYLFAFILYIVILYFYKLIGTRFDVTLITVILTFLSVAVIGVINRPTNGEQVKDLWLKKVKDKFRQSLVDGLEVVLFLFFLTMDSTSLFFLPQQLNIPLKAEIFNVDLMQISFVMHRGDFIKTTSLIGIPIFIEIIRNVLRVSAISKEYYVKYYENKAIEIEYSKFILVKRSIREGFREIKDEIIKFIAFTTILFAVFILFPRLKLLTLIVASLAALLLDLYIPSRLVQKRGTDLVSRLITKVFKL